MNRRAPEGEHELETNMPVLADLTEACRLTLIQVLSLAAHRFDPPLKLDASSIATWAANDITTHIAAKMGFVASESDPYRDEELRLNG